MDSSLSGSGLWIAVYQEVVHSGMSKIGPWLEVCRELVHG